MLSPTSVVIVGRMENSPLVAQHKSFELDDVVVFKDSFKGHGQLKTSPSLDSLRSTPGTDKYRFPNQEARVRLDLRLLYDLNKKLVFITEDVSKVVEKRKWFAEKKKKIVAVQLLAEELMVQSERQYKSFMEVERDISHPFGLEGVLM